MTALDGLQEVRTASGALAYLTPDGAKIGAAEPALGRPRPGRDLLWRAVLKGAQRVVDATAGLGSDAFHLASKGAEVVMIERSSLLHALLADALARAEAGMLGEDARLAAGRISLLRGDAREVLADLGAVGSTPVVYLDPMFPHPGGRGLPGKGMALLRAALGEMSFAEETQLLEAARSVAERRVVVKRPVRAPPLAREAPSGSLAGSTTRYDLYAPELR